MSSSFDSEVYVERQRLPGVAINLQRLMRYAMGGHDKPASLKVEYRSDVDTSEWWTFTWIDFHGQERRAEAKELELCLFRAAVSMRRDDERARKYAGMPPEEKP